MKKLLEKEHLTIQIMQDKTVIVSGPSPRCAGGVFSICGNCEASRDYATSWYADNGSNLAAHIYISSTLSSAKSKLLVSLAPALESCHSIDDLMSINGKNLTLSHCG